MKFFHNKDINPHVQKGQSVSSKIKVIVTHKHPSETVQ